MSPTETTSPRIALVGPCGAGKSTLGHFLRAAGYQVRQPAQEHSYVPNMWQRLTHPDILIYLDLDFPALLKRRPTTHGGPDRLHEQQRRLAHARAHCDFYLDTSNLTLEETQTRLLAFLQSSPLTCPPATPGAALS